MPLIKEKCDVCGKSMLISDNYRGTGLNRPGPYYCSRKKCKKQRGIKR